MKEFLERIKEKEKTFKYLSIITIIWLGLWSFPIKLSIDMISASLLYTLCMIGVILRGVFENQLKKVIFVTLFYSFLGLLLRVIIEWKEVSITNNLTLSNIVISNGFIIGIITLAYVLTPLFIRE